MGLEEFFFHVWQSGGKYVCTCGVSVCLCTLMHLWCWFAGLIVLNLVQDAFPYLEPSARVPVVLDITVWGLIWLGRMRQPRLWVQVCGHWGFVLVCVWPLMIGLILSLNSILFDTCFKYCYCYMCWALSIKSGLFIYFFIISNGTYSMNVIPKKGPAERFSPRLQHRTTSCKCHLTCDK